ARLEGPLENPAGGLPIGQVPEDLSHECLGKGHVGVVVDRGEDQAVEHLLAGVAGGGRNPSEEVPGFIGAQEGDEADDPGLFLLGPGDGLEEPDAGADEVLEEELQRDGEEVERGGGGANGSGEVVTGVGGLGGGVGGGDEAEEEVGGGGVVEEGGREGGGGRDAGDAAPLLGVAQLHHLGEASL
ncbi:hypothetical protein CRG98_037661, partial [Punica granatum]